VQTELVEASFHGAQYTFSPVDTSTVTKQQGENARGLAIIQVAPIPSGMWVKVVAKYLDALKALDRGSPSFYGLEAFIEAKVLVECLKRAGPKPTPAALVKGLETMHGFDPGGYYVGCKPEAHTGSLFVEIDMINYAGIVSR